MKKMVAVFMSFFMLFSFSGPVFASTSMENEKKEMLALIEEQLIAQDAERFLPVYEVYLEMLYEPRARGGAPYATTFGNGGSIYYEDFTGTGVEMCNTYLSADDFDDAFGGKEPNATFLGMISTFLTSIGIGSAFKSNVIGAMYSCYSYLENSNEIDIIKAGAAYNCVTEDRQGYANITIPWKTAPEAHYYDGAEVEWY